MDMFLIFLGGLIIIGIAAIVVCLAIKKFDMLHPDVVRRRWIYDNSGTSEIVFKPKKTTTDDSDNKKN